jgi:hypothetical protein
MKKLVLLLFITAGIVFQTKSQVRVYASGGPEIIFSVAEIDDPVRNGYNILRFAPWLNLQVNGNIDFGRNFGLTFGGAIRNVGFIYQYNDTAVGSNLVIKKKYRNYVFALPVGFKVGVMNSWLFYGGYEIEFPFAYKEKTFVNNTKTKFVEWFTGRVPTYYNSVYVGVQFPYGFSLKFKYYLSEFHNQDYVASDGTQPYLGLKSNIWYFSLNFGIFRNTKAYYDEKYRSKKNKDYY